ncbi:mobile intron protein [Bacillus phage 0305phi8-36]|uniref:endonuclease n=1 Tax=Bacillus phage 0305phi8-36 TaxID=458639 RepID=UPI00015A1F80|nr:endonuclease [Bacillus phage 0305phi8-36]ABS83598.1 mobile intron protein [Bacillus phage 0305phi8-36]
MDKLEKAIEFYKNGMPLLDAWKATGCGRNKLQRTLKERGLMRSPRDNSRKYTLDESFFETIDTQEKAYWLGFMYADGYVSNTRNDYNVGIALGIKDKGHLSRFKEALRATHPIGEYEGNSYGVGTKYCRFRFTSKTMYTHLVEKGVFENKSLILKFPSEDIVPKHLVHHFIRGYFDGDGSFSYSGKRDDTYAVKIMGTREFLTTLAEHIDHKPTLHKRHTDTKNSYSLEFMAKDDVRKFGRYIYNGANIYLFRKYQRYLKV